MRILSKYHDYYDSAAGHGLDPERLYRRQSEHRVVETRFWNGHPHALPVPWTRDWCLGWEPVRSVVIGFCGRYYSAWIDATWEFTPENITSQRSAKHWLPLDEAVAKLVAFSDQIDRGWWFRNDPVWLERTVREHGRIVSEIPADAKIFRLLECPVFVLAGQGGYGARSVHTVEVITNPRLQNLGFERVRDSFSAFQDIATFLANDLVDIDAAPPTVGGDEVVARAKGFDEHSFRTMPPGRKKLNRKLNRERKRSGE